MIIKLCFESESSLCFGYVKCVLRDETVVIGLFASELFLWIASFLTIIGNFSF